MTHSKTISLLLVSLLTTILAAQTLPPGVQKVTSVEGITEYTLQNGLRVLLFPDPTKSNATVNITYLVGSRHEDYGETGMAHLLEHLMFKGSTNHTNVPKELTDHGARPNGTTWYDRTNYFETFQASDENLEWALSLEADRIVNSFIAKKDLDSEMTVVRNEYEAGENAPQGILMQRVLSEFVVVGEFEPETTQKEVSDLFNSWKTPTKHTRIATKYSKVEPESKVLEAPDKANAMFAAAMPVKMKDSDPDYPALLRGNYILGSGMNSRLFPRVRGKEGLSCGVGSQFMAPSEDDSAMFMAFAICAPQNAAKVEASVKDELAQILEKGYTEAEVEAAKKGWLQGRQVSRANDAELVGRLAGQRYIGRTMAFDQQLEEKVSALTVAQIQAAMKKHLDVSQLSVYKAGDFAKAAKLC